MKTVCLLLDRRDTVIAVYADYDTAEAQCERFNNDRFLNAEERDPWAPYTVAVWGVKR